MEWGLIFLLFDLVALALLLGHSDRLPAGLAGEYLRGGALLIDVRSPSEYAASHLPNAVNIPFTGIGQIVSLRIQDRERMILLYGQLGFRSSLARRRLAALGYSHAFNLGSYDRAAKIASENTPEQIWSDPHREEVIEEALRQKELARRRGFGSTAHANS
jgi:phage shock protein E